jgi:hypothetical protein
MAVTCRMLIGLAVVVVDVVVASVFVECYCFLIIIVGSPNLSETLQRCVEDVRPWGRDLKISAP